MYWRICLALSMVGGSFFYAYLIRDALSGPNYQSAIAEGWLMSAGSFRAVTTFFVLLGALGLVFLGTMFSAWIDGVRSAAKRRRADCEAAIRRARMEVV